MSLSQRRRRRSPAVSTALGQVCRGVWSNVALTPIEVDEFVDAARLHRIAPLAHVVTREVAPSVSQLLKPDRDRAFAKNLAACALLAELTRLLGDIPWVTFKGASLSMASHPVPGLRSFNDIDVLTSPVHLRHACERLAAAGWTLLDREDMLAARPAPGEMHWISPNGFLVDLHWSMINREPRRVRFRIPDAKLIDRRRNQTLGFVDVPVLDHCDALIHTCVHAALDGANRLLQLVDADGLVRETTDWATVTTRAREWRASAQVWLVLSRCRGVLGTPLPSNLAEALGVPTTLQRFLTAVDRVAPITSIRSEHGLARLVARALRPALGATAIALVHNVALGVRDRIKRPALRKNRVPASAETLQAFLTDVEMTNANVRV